MLYLQGSICLLLQLMKRRSTILSITSGFLILLFLIGSSGAVIVEHTCYSCGLSDLHTEFFSNYSQNNDCLCDHKTTSLPSRDGNSFKSVCCTFNFEKLSLTEYNLNTLIDFSIVSTPVLSHLYISSDYPQEKPVSPIIIHNKHGGREILKSACQLII